MTAFEYFVSVSDKRPESEDAFELRQYFAELECAYAALMRSSEWEEIARKPNGNDLQKGITLQVTDARTRLKLAERALRLAAERSE